MIDGSTTFGEALASGAARGVLERYLPGLCASPQGAQFRGMSLGMMAATTPSLRDDPAVCEAFWRELADIAVDLPPKEYGGRIDPDPGYEDLSVPRASATVSEPSPVSQWGVAEIELRGPDHGNPFVDVELSATFRLGETELRCGGFYDGDGIYRIRMLAEQEGTWTFETSSTARSLDGIRGEVVVTAPGPGEHGPVRVDGQHFRHADGTRYHPWGTTAYAWTHQPGELRERTLATLARAPFTKVRMCLQPKSYLYNQNDPERFVFPRAADGFDVERFDPGYFADLEENLRNLADLGIQADLILFHPYDRWGLADLGPAVDERLVRYVVRRLAAFPNVWWAMANEYDLVAAKTRDDWERLGSLVASEDPHGHLVSIHNCLEHYDHSRPWITHASVQRVDVYRTSEETGQWRQRWGKPVVIDECGYEGDLEYAWGNLTGQEMVRRAWEGAVRGGYVCHGETYLNEREEVWWSKGGELVGESVARYAFLDRIVAEAPDGVLDPLPSDWDVPWGGVAGRYLVGYLGGGQARLRSVILPPGTFRVDVIDTWNMTVEPLAGSYRDYVRVGLPGRPFMAIRLVRVDEDG